MGEGSTGLRKSGRGRVGAVGLGRKETEKGRQCCCQLWARGLLRVISRIFGVLAEEHFLHFAVTVIYTGSQLHSHQATQWTHGLK